MNVPVYRFEEVNLSLIIMRLMKKERFSLKQIGDDVGVGPDAVKKWKHAVNLPRKREHMDGVIMMGIKYLSAEAMAECGVVTDEMRVK